MRTEEQRENWEKRGYMKNVVPSFNSVIKELYETGEFEKILSQPDIKKKRKKRVKKFRDMCEYIEEHFEGGIEGFPFIALLHECNDPLLLQDAVCYMTANEMLAK